MPKVSVIIPTYQAGRFIKEAVDSVLNQTYKDYEIIVIDDGSTDNTFQILKEYDTRIKVIRQENMGVSAARNRGIVSSKGEYIAFLDADDVWVRNKLEVQVKFLDDHSNAYLVFSNVLFLAERDIPASDLRIKDQSFFQISTPSRGKVLKPLFVKNFIGMSTAMVRKTCFEKVGLFDEDLVPNEDYDLWLRFAKHFDVDYQDAVLVKGRQHASSLNRNTPLSKLLLSHIKVKQKAIEENPSLLKALDSMTLNRCYYRFYIWLGLSYLFSGCKKKARENFRRYIQLYQCSPSSYFLFLMTFLPFRFVARFRTLAKLLNLTKQ